MCMVKISLSLSFLAIFAARRTNATARWLIYVAAALTTAGAATFVIDTIYILDRGGSFEYLSAIERYSARIIAAIWALLNASTDLTYSLIAVITIWTSSMRRTEKIQASFLMVLGTVGGIASCIRLVVSKIFDPSAQPDFAQVQLWTVIEAGTCITAASLTTLRPLAEKCVHKVQQLSSLASSKRKSYGTDSTRMSKRDEMIEWEKHLESRQSQRMSIIEPAPMRRYSSSKIPPLNTWELA